VSVDVDGVEVVSKVVAVSLRQVEGCECDSSYLELTYWLSSSSSLPHGPHEESPKHAVSRDMKP
jgi:hypothetical protein